MKHTFAILALTATLGCTAIADDSRRPAGHRLESTTQNAMRLVDGTNILTRSDNNTGFIASYLAMAPADRQELAERIVMLLKSGPAVDEQFLQFVEGNIAANRRLEKPDFDFALTNADGLKYQFSYTSNDEESVFVLNYRIMD